jgi:hypothetical protein
VTEEFDDPELERLLGRMSGAYPDANVAYEAVRGRVRQVKRRRVFVASTAACAVLFGVAAVAAQGGGSTDQLSPAEERSETTVAVTDSSAPVTTDLAGVPEDSTVTTDSTPDSSAVDTTVAGTDTTVNSSGHSGGGQGGSSGQGSGTSSPNSGPGSTNGGPSTSDHTSSSGPSTSATLPLGEHTWTSKGGAITVRNENGVLTLISVDPAAGFHEARGARDLQQQRIRIEFTGSGTTWRVEVRTDNGKAIAEITQHG